MNSDEIKKIRKKSGLNTADFGARVGVSGRTVENWEQGRTNISKPTLILIEKTFKDIY